MRKHRLLMAATLTVATMGFGASAFAADDTAAERAAERTDNAAERAANRVDDATDRAD